MTTKEQLHRLIEELSDGALDDAARLLEELRADAGGERTTEDRAWLDADLSHLGEYEPYDWGDEGPPATVNPIRYVPGQGLVVFLDEQIPVRRDQ